jgi:hypothetical protein
MVLSYSKCKTLSLSMMYNKYLFLRSLGPPIISSIQPTQKGDDYATRMNLYNLIFRMVFFFLILRYIKKMATDGGGEVVDGRARRFQARILVPG